MSDPTTTLPLDPQLRELGKRLHERYQLCARIARATWPAEETSPEAMCAATACLFIELNRQIGAATSPATAPQRPAAAASGGEAPPPCPKCGGPTRPVTAASPKAPRFRCADRQCDTPVWRVAR